MVRFDVKANLSFNVNKYISNKATNIVKPNVTVYKNV